MLRYITRLAAAPARGRPRGLALLGSTGSIGRSALGVIRLSPRRFHVAALAGARNIELLARQADEFRPEYLAVLREKDVAALRALLPQGYSPHIAAGPQAYAHMAALPEADMVLSAQVGAAGLRATHAAAMAGKIIALANKESLVLAGELLRAACAQSGAAILPVDSEHNALFQCLAGSFTDAAAPGSEDPDAIAVTGTHAPGAHNAAAPAAQTLFAKSVARLTLTASGGPFFGKSAAELQKVTPEQALRHPNWDMGAKVTIDSATLMNKGLELIEAHHLYGLPMDRLDVLIHRESIVHSLVEFDDGSQLAQLGRPNMRLPIAYCLGWPERLPTGLDRLDLAAAAALTFCRPDEAAFPCLGLARQAQIRGRGCPIVLNAANEVAVAAFLSGRLDFGGIPKLVEQCLNEYEAGRLAACSPGATPESVEAILALDTEARTKANESLGA